MHARTVAVNTTREKLVLSAVLALTVACRLDKLLETPRPPGLGVAPSRVSESADSGSREARALALTVSSSPSRVVTWTARSESGSAWLALVNDTGSTPDTLRFTLDPTNLTPGTYPEAIIVDPDDAATPSVRVPVELHIAPVAPGSGNLTVNASTTGGTPDPNGYRVTVDDGLGRTIQSNASTTYALPPGSYAVQLGDVASNCTVTDGATRSGVAVVAGQTATVTFAVNCPTTPPPTGDLTVTTSTTGSSLDPDGYTVAVDGGSAQAIGINSSVDYPDLAAGNHTVAIAGVASTCTVSGGTSRTVSVPSGGTATTTFTVTCTTPPPPTGDLTVTVSTTGGTPDPDGYTVTVDGAQSRGLGINESTTYGGIAAGSHSVQLNGLASNCTVSGSNPRSVDVPDGGTGSTTFSVSCPDPPPPPNQAPSVNAGPDRTALLAVLFTLGASFSDPDNGPWSFTIDWGDGSSSSGNASSQGAINGTHTYVLPGSYSVRVTVTDSRGGTGSDEMILTVAL